MKKYLLLMLSFWVLVAVHGQQWEIQEGYEVSFSGKKAEGSFQGLVGIIYFDPSDLNASQFNVSLDVSTIETGNNTKNKHARSENWFFAKEFPKIKFKSERVTRTSEGFLAKGQLELRGLTKEVTLPFTFTEQGGKGLFNGTLQVNRKDHGIEGNFMEFLVGDEFEVKIKVSVVRSKG